MLSFFQNLRNPHKKPQTLAAPKSVEDFLTFAEQIPGWVDRDELTYKADITHQLPGNAVIVEIGCFLGRSTVVMAGVRKLVGNGIIHVIDPFDGSGDAFSVPFYKLITNKIDQPILDEFRNHIQNAELQDFVEVHKGTAESVITNWQEPIDMLILDGDQSPKGARSAYDLWSPFLKAGGYLCLHNSGDRLYLPGHDGHRRLLLEEVKEPVYTDIHTENKTSFARKL